MEQQEIISKLKNGTVVVTFTKKDGAIRRMTCTLNSDIIPAMPVTESSDAVKKVRAVNESVQPVYDIDAAGWRSFRWDSITQVEEV